MLCNNETEDGVQSVLQSKIFEPLKAFKSSDTLDLKPLYVGASEYQKLMDKLKKKKKGTEISGT